MINIPKIENYALKNQAENENILNKLFFKIMIMKPNQLIQNKRFLLKF